ncbi:hypothetical protein TNCV_1087801 [Trichonephila clavipes]|uniref:HTH psq-type domain-containing protein n=1 Tax=Trichonephila clavipes TaxID=2585209 RepID=A0A8X6VQ17_TRICX|nr:hypothetical protein TNCV_1087801 [Trichonephila clavipes]
MTTPLLLTFPLPPPLPLLTTGASINNLQQRRPGARMGCPRLFLTLLTIWQTPKSKAARGLPDDGTLSGCAGAQVDSLVGYSLLRADDLLTMECGAEESSGFVTAGRDRWRHLSMKTPKERPNQRLDPNRQKKNYLSLNQRYRITYADFRENKRIECVYNHLGKGEVSTAIGKHFNLGESTVRAIKKNEAAIRKSVISGTKLSTKFASYTRDVLLERTESAIAIWIEEQVQRRIPVSGYLIQEKAL